MLVATIKATSKHLTMLPTTEKRTSRDIRFVSLALCGARAGSAAGRKSNPVVSFILAPNVFIRLLTPPASRRFFRQHARTLLFVRDNDSRRAEQRTEFARAQFGVSPIEVTRRPELANERFSLMRLEPKMEAPKRDVLQRYAECVALGVSLFLGRLAYDAGLFRRRSNIPQDPSLLRRGQGIDVCPQISELSL
jgi:hypothetical protein